MEISSKFQQILKSDSVFMLQFSSSFSVYPYSATSLLDFVSEVRLLDEETKGWYT